MTEGYRDIDQAADEAFVKSLTGITGEQVRGALRLGTGAYETSRVLNRLHNMQHRAKAKEITAGMLVTNGFEVGAEVSIPSVDAKGRLMRVLDINNDSTIAVTIRGGHHLDSSFLVERCDTVVIWPVDYQQPNRELRAAGMRPRITPIPRPDYSEPGVATVSASAIKRMPSDYLGKRVVFDGGQVDGQLAEVKVHSTAPNSVIFKVKGEQHQLTLSESVKVYPKVERVITEGYLKAEYIASHLTTFFGKNISIKNKVTGELQEMRVNGVNPNHYFFVVNGASYLVHENDTVQVHEPSYRVRGRYPWASALTPPPRPGQNPFLANHDVRGNMVARGPRPGQRTLQEMVPDIRPPHKMTAWHLATNNTDFRGRRVVLPGRNIEGILSDYSLDKEGKVVMIIDGKIYKSNYGRTVRMHNKEN